MSDPLAILHDRDRRGLATAVTPGGLLEQQLDRDLKARLVRLGGDGLEVRDGRKKLTPAGDLASVVLDHARSRSAELQQDHDVVALPRDRGRRLIAIEQLLAELLTTSAPATWRELARPLWRLVRRARSEIRSTNPLQEAHR